MPGDRIAVVIEDDADIRRLLEEVLEQGGFEVHSAGNGLEGVERVRTYRPTLVTLDISLPGIDGFEVAKRIRSFSDTYLIMLTARNDEVDTLMGLGAGADDYVAKPFRPRELRARIDAMLRRPRLAPAVGPATVAPPPTPVAAPVEPAAVAPAAVAPPAVAAAASVAAVTAANPGSITAPHHLDGDGWLEHRGLRLEPSMHVVELDGVELDLTRSEFELLHLLMESKRRVRSKSDLALALRGESYVTSHYVSEADKRGVEVHLANLRRKLGESATQPRWIETVRGVGYRITAEGGA